MEKKLQRTIKYYRFMILDCKYNPDYKYCKDRLKREYDYLYK